MSEILAKIIQRVGIDRQPWLVTERTETSGYFPRAQAKLSTFVAAPDLLEAAEELENILEHYALSLKLETHTKSKKVKADWTMEILAARDKLNRAIAQAKGGL